MVRVISLDEAKLYGFAAEEDEERLHQDMEVGDNDGLLDLLDDFQDRLLELGAA